MNTRREIDGRHGEKGMDPVETNHIFQNVPMTRSTPGKKKKNHCHDPCLPRTQYLALDS